MNRLEAIDFIENRKWQGSSLDLGRMKKLMSLLGNPQKKLNCIHIAGTNGKGSACAMITSILMEAGYKVGTYISPHLVNYEERISINNKNISEKEFILLTEKVKKVCENLDFEPRVFEILTAMAFMYFNKHKVDVVVLEVGMGGRLDATNIIDKSLVSLIMNIGLEHTEILGDTLSKIAYEKAGIIKDNGDIVFYHNKKEVVDTFKKVVIQKKANSVFVDFKKINIIKETSEYSYFDYGNLKNIKLALLGKHQFYNASVVIEACDVLKKKGYKITNKNIKDGLKKVSWQARLSILSQDPLFILDGAHNPQCANALKESLPKLLNKKKAIFLCGMLKDKDYKAVMEMMVPYAKEFICLTPNSNRALDNNELAKLLNKKGVEANCASTVKEGIKLSLTRATDKGILLCFGSLYLAGDIIKYFNEAHKDYLRESIIKKRNTLSKRKVQDYSKEIVNRIIKTKEFKDAKNILIYNSINNEVDLSGLTNLKNKNFAYPKCAGDKMLALIGDGNFVSGKYGIKEPIADAKEMKKIDLVICPMFAFDSDLNRLGYGKGYYDRFLDNKKCIKLGVAYDFQEVDSINTNEFDKKMDLIITNNKTFRKAH